MQNPRLKWQNRGAVQKSQKKSKAACDSSVWSVSRTSLGSLLKFPNVPPSGKKWEWVTLNLTQAGNVTEIKPSTPAGNRSQQEVDPITQAGSSFIKVKMATERGKGWRDRQRGWEGRRDRKSGLPPSSHIVTPLEEVNKTTPSGDDIMQRRSQREETLIAS